MPKVLIIDDRRENIVFIANDILKPQGYKIITAMNGAAGLAKAEKEKPDLIITDVKLPQMSGLEILEQLQQKDIHIPAIVMTFHGSEETAMRALRLGACDYLIKPFTVEEMETALARALTPRASQGVQATDEARVAELEQALAETRATLAERESQIAQMQNYLSDSFQKSELAEITKRAEAWEEDNARLNELLAQTKEKLSETERRAHALEEALEAQKMQMGKYRKEVKRLAEELRNMSEAVRLMSQDLADQVARLEVLTPHDVDS